MGRSIFVLGTRSLWSAPGADGGPNYDFCRRGHDPQQRPADNHLLRPLVTRLSHTRLCVGRQPPLRPSFLADPTARPNMATYHDINHPAAGRNERRLRVIFNCRARSQSTSAYPQIAGDLLQRVSRPLRAKSLEAFGRRPLRRGVASDGAVIRTPHTKAGVALPILLTFNIDLGDQRKNGI
jgi:hypothetical protein